MKFVKSAALVLGLLVVASSHGRRRGGPRRRRALPVQRDRDRPGHHRRRPGIGKLTASAVESMARQPELAAQHPDGHDHLGRADRGRDVLRDHRPRLRHRHQLIPAIGGRPGRSGLGRTRPGPASTSRSRRLPGSPRALRIARSLTMLRRTILALGLLASSSRRRPLRSLPAFAQAHFRRVPRHPRASEQGRPGGRLEDDSGGVHKKTDEAGRPRTSWKSRPPWRSGRSWSSSA